MKMLVLILTISFALTSLKVNALWLPTTTEICSGCGNAIVFSLATKDSTLFAGTGGGIFISNDYGSSWTYKNFAIFPYPHAISCITVNGNNIFALSGGNDGPFLWLSTDNGNNWTLLTNGLPDFYNSGCNGNYTNNSIAVNGNTIAVAFYGCGIYLSNDNGISWTNTIPYTQYLPLIFTTSLSFNGSDLYAGTNGGGVFKSTDNGVSWSAVNNGLSVGDAYYSLVVSSGNIFAGGYGGVFLSDNNGNSWSSVSSGLPANQLVSALLIVDNILFAGTGQGVFYSTDNGGNWTAINDGLPTSSIYSITSLTLTGGNLFAGTWMQSPSPSGVWINALPVPPARCNLSISVNPSNPAPICVPNCVLLQASATGGAGAISYLWSPNGEHQDSIDACFTGNYSVVATDSYGCTASASVYVTANPQPSCNINPIPEANLPVANTNNNQLCATASGGTTYVWSLTSSDNSWYIEGANNGLCITFHSGTFGSSATFTFAVTSSDGCLSDPCVISLTPEAHEECSYTQGFYGNTGGLTTCIGKTTTCAVQQALGWNDLCTAINKCNPIVVGYGNTKKITIGCSEAASVIAKLPGNSTAAALPTGGPWTCSTVPSSLLQNGRFKNVLLGQAITLAINIRLYPTLADLHLTSSSFTTYQSADCNPNSANIIPNSALNFTIPQSIINCLGSNTNTNKVSNLLNLANLALGGQPFNCAAGSPSLTDINNAINAINNGFDRCRIISGYNLRFTNISTTGERDFRFSYYPNPSTGNTTAQFVAPSDGVARMELYNMNGSLVKELFNNYVNEGNAYTAEFGTETWEPGIYLIFLIVGDASAFGKLVIMKR